MTDIRTKIAQYHMTEQMNLMRTYAQDRIETVRKQMDVAPIEKIPALQGAIAEMKDLLKLVTPKQTYPDYDGSYQR